MILFQKILLGALMASALMLPSYEAHACKEHIKFENPATVDEAWALIDKASVAARVAIDKNDLVTIHDAGEKIFSAAAALHDNPQAIKEEDGEKLTAALNQLSKIAGTLCDAAERKDTYTATEALDELDTQKDLTKSLYPNVFEVEP